MTALIILGALAVAGVGWLFIWMGGEIETMDATRRPEARGGLYEPGPLIAEFAS